MIAAKTGARTAGIDAKTDEIDASKRQSSVGVILFLLVLTALTALVATARHRLC
jgi:hypothetical protein